MGTLTSWNPLGHSRPVTGLILLKYRISLKIRPVGAELFHEDRQYEANNDFPQFSERAPPPKKTISVYDCSVEDVEYICNSNSTLCLFYFAIFVVLLS